MMALRIRRNGLEDLVVPVRTRTTLVQHPHFALVRKNGGQTLGGTLRIRRATQIFVVAELGRRVRSVAPQIEERAPSVSAPIHFLAHGKVDVEPGVTLPLTIRSP